jgi:hypothetical protein
VARHGSHEIFRPKGKYEERMPGKKEAISGFRTLARRRIVPHRFSKAALSLRKTFFGVGFRNCSVVKIFDEAIEGAIEGVRGFNSPARHSTGPKMPLEFAVDAACFFAILLREDSR